jgi:hypothetical protein
MQLSKHASVRNKAQRPGAAARLTSWIVLWSLVQDVPVPFIHLSYIAGSADGADVGSVGRPLSMCQARACPCSCKLLN